MLDVSSREIVFVFTDSAILTANLNIRNILPSSYISYKIKTTTPDYFEVNPSKGILQPGHSKPIQFKTNRILTKTEARGIAAREKFLIQCIPIADKRKPEEIEQLWGAYRNDSSKLENIRLKLRIQGIDDTGGDYQKVAEHYGGSQHKSRATASFPTPEPRDTYMRTPRDDDPYERLEELKRRQEVLEKQRDDIIRASSGRQSQPKSILPNILIFALCFVTGIALSKYVFHSRHHDSKIVYSHPSESGSSRYHNSETVKKQLQIKGPSGSHGPQKIIVTNQDNSEVILTNDGSDEPIRLTVKTTQMEDGTHKVIIS